VTAASAAAKSLDDVLGKVVGSPLGIALQFAMIGLVVLLYRVDWTKVLRRRSGTSSDATTASIAPAAKASETGSSD